MRKVNRTFQTKSGFTDAECRRKREINRKCCRAWTRRVYRKRIGSYSLKLTCRFCQKENASTLKIFFFWSETELMALAGNEENANRRLSLAARIARYS